MQDRLLQKSYNRGVHMKKIKIKICNYDPKDTCSYGYYFLNILNKYYEVELSEDPDYVIYNEATFEYLKYDCVRIFYTGENIHPNFNLCDYAIAFDYMNFGDRYYRFPIYLVATFYRAKELMEKDSFKLGVDTPFTKEDLAKKTEFCSFVYSNYLGDSSRETMFEKLSAYKKVNSGGRYLNNIGGPTDNKLGFETKHKFSIAFENSSNSGYTTEKIVNAFAAKTIPIFWGNPDVSKEFNENRFINCHKFKNFDEVIERVKEIDQNDDLYMEIMNQPVLNSSYDIKEMEKGLDSFFRNIFDQSPSDAKRIRVNKMRQIAMEANENLIAKSVTRKAKIKKLFALIYKPFKNIRLVEKLKQNYLKKK